MSKHRENPYWMEIWKLGDGVMGKCENLEIWKFGNLEIGAI